MRVGLTQSNPCDAIPAQGAPKAQAHSALHQFTTVYQDLFVLLQHWQITFTPQYHCHQGHQQQQAGLELNTKHDAIFHCRLTP